MCVNVRMAFTHGALLLNFMELKLSMFRAAHAAGIEEFDILEHFWSLSRNNSAQKLI